MLNISEINRHNFLQRLSRLTPKRASEIFLREKFLFLLSLSLLQARLLIFVVKFVLSSIFEDFAKAWTLSIVDKYELLFSVES